MFRALLAHLQEAPHKQRLVYCMGVMFVGCYQSWSVVCAANPEDEQVMLETCERLLIHN
jgi:hypothetical protein